jgi:hypothetical protein
MNCRLRCCHAFAINEKFVGLEVKPNMFDTDRLLGVEEYGEVDRRIVKNPVDLIAGDACGRVIEKSGVELCRFVDVANADGNMYSRSSARRTQRTGGVVHIDDGRRQLDQRLTQDCNEVHRKPAYALTVHASDDLR